MNRGELFAAVASYAHRGDVAPMLPVFLGLTEQRIYYGEANAPALRIAAMRRCTTLTGYDRPDDFLEAVSLHEVDRPDRQLTYCPLDRLTSSTRTYSWDGGSLALPDGQDLPITMHYWGRFDPLDEDTDTNWLLTNAPNVYLASMLTELARWARDDALGAREAANYASAVSSLHSTDKAAALSGSILTMRGPR